MGAQNSAGKMIMISLAKKKNTGDIQLISDKGEIIFGENGLSVRFKTNDGRKPSYSIFIDNGDIEDLNDVLQKLINFNKEGAEMSELDKIRNKTIFKIKDDIYELRKEFSSLHPREHDKRLQKLQAIKSCRELIEDLQKEGEEL